MGAEAVQVFNTNPRRWRLRIPGPGEIDEFTGGLRRHGLPLFFHSAYLINLASSDRELRRRSAEALGAALVTGARAGAEALVTHVGSYRGATSTQAQARLVHSVAAALENAAAALEQETAQLPFAVVNGKVDAAALAGEHTTDLAVHRTTTTDHAAVPPRIPSAALPVLLLETGAGAGKTIGGRLEELAVVLARLDATTQGIARRFGICIDSAHLFAAGYPLHEDKGLDDLILALRELGLLDRIGLVHLNDSKTPLGARRDQHENLGEGEIGYEALARVVRHPALAGIPFILEVPGWDRRGPDATNVAIAKAMRAGVPRSGD
jgi:deoxyribonuclease-4